MTNAAGGGFDASNNSSLGTATITLNGGTNGGKGATGRLRTNTDASGASFTVNGNAILDLSSNGANTAIGSIAGNGTFQLGGTTLTTGANNASTNVSGVIVDGGSFGGAGASLVKTGTGTLMLSGANTYTGSTTVNNGTLQLGTVGSAGSISATSHVGINNGGIFSIVNTPGTGGVSTFTNNVSNGVAGTGTLNINSANTNILSGAITDGAAGQIALTQSGSGTTILTGLNNTFSGVTSITGGILQVGGIVNSANVGGTLSAASNVSIGSAGTLVVYDVVGGTLGNQITAANGATLNITASTAVTFSGKITSGASNLNVNVSGDGILANANNDYFGTTTVQNGGTLQLGTATTATSLGLTGLFVDGGGTLVVTNMSGSLLNVSGGAAAGSSPGVINVNSASNVTLQGTFKDGGAPLSIQQTGTGTTSFLGNMTYTGQTLVTAGTLNVGTGSTLGNTTVNVQGVY